MTLEQARLRVLESLLRRGFLLRGRREAAHQLQHVLVMIVDFEQRCAALAIAPDGA